MNAILPAMISDRTRQKLLLKYGIRPFEANGDGYHFLSNCTLDKKKQTIKFVYGNGVAYTFKISYMEKWFPPPHIAKINGRWKKDVWDWVEKDGSYELVYNTKLPKTHVKSIKATRIQRIRWKFYWAESKEVPDKHELALTPNWNTDEAFQSLRIYFNNDTATERFSTHILDICEPNWTWFWSCEYSKKWLEEWLRSRRENFTVSFPILKPGNKYWNYFSKCSLSKDGEIITITMNGGYEYFLPVKDLLTQHDRLTSNQGITRSNKK